MAQRFKFGRTNTFCVWDEKAYQQFFSTLCEKNNVHDSSYRDDSGAIYHSFESGRYFELINGVPQCMPDFENFCQKLQPILRDEEIFLYVEDIACVIETNTERYIVRLDECADGINADKIMQMIEQCAAMT